MYSNDELCLQPANDLEIKKVCPLFPFRASLFRKCTSYCINLWCHKGNRRVWTSKLLQRSVCSTSFFFHPFQKYQFFRETSNVKNEYCRKLFLWRFFWEFVFSENLWHLDPLETMMNTNHLKKDVEWGPYCSGVICILKFFFFLIYWTEYTCLLLRREHSAARNENWLEDATQKKHNTTQQKHNTS